MIIQCQNCGAPLQVDGTRTFVDCRYCGLSNKVKKSVTLFTHEPADWQKKMVKETVWRLHEKLGPKK